MKIKKTIEIVKEIPSDANPKQWLDNGWTEVKKVVKAKPKKKAKK
tara:strand:+ start:231 stop:365 length:135 start_codon:yes stop_codon:yes gene_type:complete